MISEISKCQKCPLSAHQPPLLDSTCECDVMWIGLSAKPVNDFNFDIPLSKNTKSGEIIYEIESRNDNCRFYKTNIVKCLPLDNNGKLRYPSVEEMNICIQNLLIEIKLLKPKIVVLLGRKVIESISQNLHTHFDKFSNYDYEIIKFRELFFIPIHHPSYIYVYKRQFKEQYISSITHQIQSIIT